MSYILDALRKSERERALGEVPSLTAVYRGEGPAHRRRGAALLLTLGVLLLGYEAYRALPGPLTATALSVTLGAAAGPRARPEATTQPTVGAAAQVRGLVPLAETSEPAALARVPETARSEAASGLAADAALHAPALDINVVSYSSDANRRFVMVDQQIYREGDHLPGGMLIERITSEGPIVRYQGSRFLKTH